MAYLNDIPQPSDQLASSQPEILGNFQYIQTTEQVDHAWDGSGIPSSIDGTHQKLSMPNQLSDITSLGATGCALIQYAIANNLYTWNGAKNPVSGVSASNATYTVSLAYSTIATVINDCIGFVQVNTQSANGADLCVFFSIGGVVLISDLSGGTARSYTVSGLNIQYRNTAATYTAKTKYIYWPI